MLFRSLTTWLDDSRPVSYDLGPELFQLLLPAVGDHERLVRQRRQHNEVQPTPDPAPVVL